MNYFFLFTCSVLAYFAFFPLLLLLFTCKHSSHKFFMIYNSNNEFKLLIFAVTLLPGFIFYLQCEKVFFNSLRRFIIHIKITICIISNNNSFLKANKIFFNIIIILVFLKNIKKRQKNAFLIITHNAVNNERFTC